MVAPTEEEIAEVDAHFYHRQQHTSRGVVRLVGRTDASELDNMSIVLYRAETLDAAIALSKVDAAVARGVTKCIVAPFHVALATDFVIA